MRFYQFEYKKREPHHAPDMTQAPVVTEWFGSEREAVVRRLELFKGGELLGRKKDNPIHIVEIPTKKADLLVWLNKEAV